MNKFLIFACQEPGRINSPLKSGKGDSWSRIPASFFMRISHPEAMSSLSRISFSFPIYHIRAKILANHASSVAVKSRILLLLESRTVFWSNPAESQDPVPDLGPWTTCLCRTQTVFYVLLFEVEFNIMNEESLRWSQRRRSSAGAHHLMGSCLTSRGTQREYSSKPLKHSIIERILVFKR